MARERIHDAEDTGIRTLFGPLDRHLRLLRERFGVKITLRHGVLMLEGEDEGTLREVVRRVRRVLEQTRRGETLDEEQVDALLLAEDEQAAKRGARSEPVARPGRHVPGPAHPAHPAHPAGPPGGWRGARSSQPDVRPRTPNQERYVRAIRSFDVVFSVGPAGTGKTFLAVVEAVASLRAGQVRRIVLTRPAVEAGEKLGFLPGDFQAKINPYLRPLYDALGELLPYGEMQRYVASDVIEIVPLAYMRGRTLKDAFIILDEAQNTTQAQMKMFLTRLGMGSKTVITGDVTQVDLPAGVASGLTHVVGLLGDVPGIEIVRFVPQDILRHPLVQRIVDAYDGPGRPHERDGRK